MKQSIFSDGSPCIELNIKIPVTIGIFKIALTDFYFENNKRVAGFDINEELKSLSKIRAQRILKNRLQRFGVVGVHDDLQILTADIRIYTDIQQAVKNWISTNYPYLNT